MKKISVIFLMLLSCVMMVCCNDDDTQSVVKDNISLETTKITMGSSNGVQVVPFFTTSDWTAVVDEKAASWCRLKSSSGIAGDNNLEILVDENVTYDQRNASVTIVCGSFRKLLTVSQKQKDALLIASNKIEVAEGGGDVIVDVKANVDYLYFIDEGCSSWIHKVKTESRGLSASYIKLWVDPNEDMVSREGKIHVSSSEFSEDITVYQEASTPRIVISQSNIVVPSAGETVLIEIRSNTEYDYFLPEVDWIFEPTTRAMSTYSHYIEVAENKTYDSRSAEIVFKNRVTGDIETVNITQMQKDAIVVAKNAYTVNGEENRLNFAVNTNVDFDIKVSESWIQPIEKEETRALVQKNLSFLVEKNPTTSTRSSKIVLTFGEIQQTITVIQNGRVDLMNMAVIHSCLDFSALDFYGEKVTGSVDWGDGSRTDLSQGHRYVDAREKVSNFETMGVEEFKIKSLKAISSIFIYCNEGKSGTVEDFEVEDREWD